MQIHLSPRGRGGAVVLLLEGLGLPDPLFHEARCPDDGPVRLDSERSESHEQVGENLDSAQGPGGGKATPEHPARTFEYPLLGGVVLPAIRAVELVSIAFHGETSVTATLDNQIDAVGAGPDLRSYPVTTKYQLLLDVALDL